MRIGAYILDLYCDQCGASAQFAARNESKSVVMAQEFGWKVGRRSPKGGKFPDSCPYCEEVRIPVEEGIAMNGINFHETTQLEDVED